MIEEANKNEPIIDTKTEATIIEFVLPALKIFEKLESFTNLKKFKKLSKNKIK